MKGSTAALLATAAILDDGVVPLPLPRKTKGGVPVSVPRSRRLEREWRREERLLAEIAELEGNLAGLHDKMESVPAMDGVEERRLEAEWIEAETIKRREYVGALWLKQMRLKGRAEYLQARALLLLNEADQLLAAADRLHADEEEARAKAEQAYQVARDNYELKHAAVNWQIKRQQEPFKKKARTVENLLERRRRQLARVRGDVAWLEEEIKKEAEAEEERQLRLNRGPELTPRPRDQHQDTAVQDGEEGEAEE